MQKVIIFKKRSFWSSGIDLEQLNEKIRNLNSSGWVVKSIIPTATIAGVIASYTILIENDE